MGLLDKFLEKRMTAIAPQITQKVTSTVVEHLDNAMTKAVSSATPLGSPGLKRYEFVQGYVNGNMQNRKKPGASVSFETLRRFSVSHEVSRAAINYRKRQIVGLDWDIVTEDGSDTKSYKAQVDELKLFFKHLGGHGNGYRKFIDKVVEDVMVLDALALERQKTRGGGLYTLIPVDAATIRLMVDESGATPLPPEIAYKQIIRGMVTAEMTTDDMIYEMMNPRNDSPYGLAPLETLIVIVTSSLKAGMYNLAYLTDGNVPEGFYSMPETWQPQQIKDFQEYFDAMMAGNDNETRKLKFMPQGDYVPTKKPEDMAFQEFNDWLMKITCAVFDVSPQDIGFSPKTGLGGKGFGEVQEKTSEKKGLRPLANFLEEIFTRIIQEDFGFKELKFQYTSLLEQDAKAIAETNEILIRSGQRTVDELRTDEGLAPLGVDKPFYAGQVTFLDEESQNARAAAEEMVQGKLQSGASKDEERPEGEADKSTKAATSGVTKSAGRDSAGRNPIDVAFDLRQRQIQELRTIRKSVVQRMKQGKTLRPYSSDILPLEILEDVNSHIMKGADLDEARRLFDQHIGGLEVDDLEDALSLRKELAGRI